MRPFLIIICVSLFSLSCSSQVQILDSNTNSLLHYTNLTVNAGLDQTVCAGTAITLSGSGANSYIWDNGITNGTPFTPTVTTTYTVIGTDANGCTATDQVTITVFPLPIPSFTYTGFCQAEPFIFTDATTPSYLNYTYQWDIDANTTIDYYTQNCSHLFNQPGYHPVKLTVTDQCGVSNSITQYVYVTPSSSVPSGINYDCCVDYPGQYDITDYSVPANTTVPWNNVFHTIKGTIVIGQGCTLIVSNGTRLKFGPLGKIVVESGGTLEISGNSILKNLCFSSKSDTSEAFPPCCLNMWEGIWVLGTNGTPHWPFNQQLTGRVIINGATIEDAHIAILVGDISFPYNGGTPSNPYASTGRNGYIDVSNCEFRNNGIDIKFLPFIPPTGAGYLQRINLSKIQHCTFTSPGNLIDLGYNNGNYYTYHNQFNPYYGDANSLCRTTKGIEIWGQILPSSGFGYNNTFNNVEVGIASDDASYNVSNSNFDNVARSIYIFNNNPDLYSTRHQIINNTFKKSSNNAIEITSGWLDYIRGNVFGDIYYTNQSLNPRSILLNSTSDYTINDNTFNVVEQAIVPNGISTGSNFIGYENGGNNFNRTRINIFGSGNNSFLQTKCNNSDNAFSDYFVNWYIIGSLADQGLPFDASLQPIDQTKLPTGNRFYQSPSLNEIEGLAIFIYYQHNAPIERKASTNSSSITIDTEPVNFDVANPDNSCLLSNGGNNTTQLLAAYQQELTAIQQYQNQYNLLLAQIDKGQTNYLLSIINSMAPGQLKNTLLSHFPLSDTVIVATVFRNNPLAPGLLKEVLTSNCPVSNNVWKQINNKVNELPLGIASQIKHAQGYNPTVTTLTTLQRQIALHTSNSKQLIQKIVLNYLDSDSVVTAINFLKTVPFTDAKMLVISSLAEDSLSLSEASSRLQLFMPSNEAEQDWKTIEGIYINLKQNGRTVFDMDSTQLSQVWQVALKEEHNIGVGNARSILYQLYGTEFPFNYTPDFMTNKKAKIETNNSEINTEQYQIYPNPSTGKITVCSKEPFSEGETINITDVTGKIVMHEKLPVNVSEYNLTISLSYGIYLCKIYNGEEHLFEKNIIIQK